MSRSTVLILTAVLLGAPGAGSAKDAPGWTERKCALYARAWRHATQGNGLDGVGPDFVAAHEAFLATGCHAARICPMTAAERELADELTLMAVAEGMTGSFLPFACPP